MDSNMYFRKAAVGAMSASFTSTWYRTGPQTVPLMCDILIPSIVSGDSIIAKLEFSHTDGGTVESTTWLKSLTAAGRYVLPFFSQWEFVKLTLTATNAATATALAFGAVEAKIVPVGYDAQK